MKSNFSDVNTIKTQCAFLKLRGVIWLHITPPTNHLPSLGVNYNCMRLINHAWDQGFAVASSTYLGHLDHISTRVSPVQVPCHPVHSDAPGHFQIRNLKTNKKLRLQQESIKLDKYSFFVYGRSDFCKHAARTHKKHKVTSRLVILESLWRRSRLLLLLGDEEEEGKS